LGEVLWFYGTGFVPGERVDMYLYRPSTLAGWPFPGGPYWGTWWWTLPESEMRRQSWPAWQFADGFGVYFAEFMLPRDEVWYPCGLPYNWNCSFVIDPGDPINPPIIEYHSPAYEGNFEAGLEWPHFDAYTYYVLGDWAGAKAMANPMDCVSPLEAHMIGESGHSVVFSMEVDGYFWKSSDLEEPFYWIGWP
jgi:hypothetical protein